MYYNFEEQYCGVSLDVQLFRLALDPQYGSQEVDGHHYY